MAEEDLEMQDVDDVVPEEVELDTRGFTIRVVRIVLML